MIMHTAEFFFILNRGPTNQLSCFLVQGREGEGVEQEKKFKKSYEVKFSFLGGEVALKGKGRSWRRLDSSSSFRAAPLPKTISFSKGRKAHKYGLWFGLRLRGDNKYVRVSVEVGGREGFSHTALTEATPHFRETGNPEEILYLNIMVTE
jgi:hypothetical protein